MFLRSSFFFALKYTILLPESPPFWNQKVYDTFIKTYFCTPLTPKFSSLSGSPSSYFNWHSIWVHWRPFCESSQFSFSGINFLSILANSPISVPRLKFFVSWKWRHHMTPYFCFGVYFSSLNSSFRKILGQFFSPRENSPLSLPEYQCNHSNWLKNLNLRSHKIGSLPCDPTQIYDPFRL